MHVIETFSLLIGLPLVMIVAGYGIAARLKSADFGERLAVATLAGLCLFIWNVSVVGFFRPISGILAWFCLWPLAWTLVDRTARRALFRDFATAVRNRHFAIAAGTAGLFLLILLWPLLSRPNLVFYDGTSNHDSFFWISGAEQLKRHTYMVEPVKSALQPFYNGVGVLSGWKPMWGRISGEGLLALLSSIVGLSPLKLYIAATAALFIPWVAATFLVARTFLITRLSTAAVIALTGTQPLFIFFHGNANLPNLLGVLTGGLVVVATARSLRTDSDRYAWLALLALSLNALLCSYPEVAPFILLPGGLIGLRAAFIRNDVPVWRRLAPTFLAYVAGLALNPLTSIRAWYGFFASLGAARADENWANIFEVLPLSSYIPAMLTMNLQTSADIGSLFATLCSLLLILVLVFVYQRSHDRVGAIMMMSGTALLLAYTVLTDFSYGWQKTAQFGGVFIPALFVGAIHGLSGAPTHRRWRLASRLVLICLSLFLLYSTGRNFYLSHKWSERKAITDDWFTLRDYARKHFFAAPVLVDAMTFRMAFFQSMWAIYFLNDSHPVFTERGTDSGGYLRWYVRIENRDQTPPAACLVDAEWAGTWDANSPRLLETDSIVLLAAANRVLAVEGLFPDKGVPEFAAGKIDVTVRPHRASQLRLKLAVRADHKLYADQRWRIANVVDGKVSHTAELAGPPPWLLEVPLTAGRDNRINITSASSASSDAFPFLVQKLRIESVP
jgi:hypothetical protein